MLRDFCYYDNVPVFWYLNPMFRTFSDSTSIDFYSNYALNIISKKNTTLYSLTLKKQEYW